MRGNVENYLKLGALKVVLSGVRGCAPNFDFSSVEIMFIFMFILI